MHVSHYAWEGLGWGLSMAANKLKSLLTARYLTLSSKRISLEIIIIVFHLHLPLLNFFCCVHREAQFHALDILFIFSSSFFSLHDVEFLEPYERYYRL